MSQLFKDECDAIKREISQVNKDINKRNELKREGKST
jgi:hypothetical protein